MASKKPVHPFDNPEKISAFLSELQNKDFSSEDFDDVALLMDKNLGTIPFSGICINKGTELFRARKNPWDNSMFHEFSDIFIRNDSDIQTFGRANLRQQSVFYCSLDPLTAAREVTQWQLDDLGALVKKGVKFPNYNPFTQFMTISKWVTKQDLFFFTAFEEEGVTSESPGHDSIRNHFNTRYEFDQDRYKTSEKLVIEFFNSEFTKNTINGHFDYFISSYYSNLCYKMAESGKVSGLIYRSVAFDLEGYNFAIPRQSLEKLQFEYADFCYTYNSNGKDGFENQKIIVAPSYRATLQPDNTLLWKDLHTPVKGAV